MPTIKFLCLSPLLLLAAFAQAQLSDPGALQICAHVKDVKLPEAEYRPSAEEAKELEKCVSEDLYFGYKAPPDYEAARKCAYLEMSRDLKNAAFSGKTILMMVYANGRGATRNLDAALKLACEVPGAPGDWAGRIHQLDHMRQSTAANFNICDHSSGPYWYAQCAIQGDKADKIQREKRFAAMQAKWTRDEKLPFAALRTAANRYFKLRATKETDLTMTFEVQEMALLENTFIEMLDQAARDDIPKAGKEDLQKAEADLSAAFAQTQNGKKTKWGTVTAEDIKSTQMAWAAYRDAWLTFGKVKYPKITPASWKTWLALQRRELLEKFMH